MQVPNPHQRSVIEHGTGPMLVIAGPGSGKSYSLVERIANLIINRGVKPEELFVATFTEKAANELLSRITRRLLEANISANVDDMYIGTFHSLCLRILEDYRDYSRLKKNFKVLDQFDQTYFFFQHLHDFEKLAPVEVVAGKGDRSRWQKADLLCRWMNQLSEEMISPEQLFKDVHPDTDALGKWRKLYLELLADENLLDFSLIQQEAYDLLVSHPDTVLAKLKAKFRHILVDEYQDTNTIQERLLFTLLNDEQNICVVGDDDQGLYRFRGANIRNILEFPDKFPEGKCAIYTLATNYRSDPGIIDFYNKWMDEENWMHEGQSFRYAKKIVPPPDKKGTPNPVFKVNGEPGRNNWHERVLAFLKDMKANRLSDWNQVAFLFQSVRSPKPKALAQFLEANGVPVHAPRSDMFFERNEITLMLGAYLFLFPGFGKIRSEWKEKWPVSDSMQALWDYYDSCLKQFVNVLQGAAGRELLGWCRRTADEIGHMRKALDYGWASLFYQLLQFEPFAGFVNISEAAGDERPARNLAIFSQLLVKFEYLHHIQVLSPDYLDKNIGDFFNHFFRYIWQGGIDEYEDPRDYAPKGAVSFMTIHQAKGLEFPVTVVGSLRNVPRKQADTLGELLIERKLGRHPCEPQELIKNFDFRRLFYTAFSRAQNLLILTCQEELNTKGTLKVPSRYFLQLYKPLPSYREADLTGLELDTIKDSTAKNSYSYTSHILVYEGCPRQYQFFRHWEFTPVRQASMIFGILVHETIEDIHKQALAGKPEAITPENIKEWFDRNYRNLSKRERVYLDKIRLKTAYDQVLRYVDRKAGDWSDIRGTEVDVSLVQDEYILKGRIDLIKGKGDTVEIVDFKAIPKPNQYAEKHLIERFRRQLEIYAWLVEQRHGLKVSAMNIYYTGEDQGSPYKRFPYKAGSVQNTISQVDTVINEIDKGNFGVSERPAKQCKECDLRSFCDRTL